MNYLHCFWVNNKLNYYITLFKTKGVNIIDFNSNVSDGINADNINTGWMETNEVGKYYVF